MNVLKCTDSIVHSNHKFPNKTIYIPINKYESFVKVPFCQQTYNNVNKVYYSNNP